MIIATDLLTDALHLFRAQTWADLVGTYCKNSYSEPGIPILVRNTWEHITGRRCLILESASFFWRKFLATPSANIAVPKKPKRFWAFGDLRKVKYVAAVNDILVALDGNDDRLFPHRRSLGECDGTGQHHCESHGLKLSFS